MLNTVPIEILALIIGRPMDLRAFCCVSRALNTRIHAALERLRATMVDKPLAFLLISWNSLHLMLIAGEQIYPRLCRKVTAAGKFEWTRAILQRRPCLYPEACMGAAKIDAVDFILPYLKYLSHSDRNSLLGVAIRNIAPNVLKKCATKSGALSLTRKMVEEDTPQNLRRVCAFMQLEEKEVLNQSYLLALCPSLMTKVFAALKDEQNMAWAEPYLACMAGYLGDKEYYDLCPIHCKRAYHVGKWRRDPEHAPYIYEDNARRYMDIMQLMQIIISGSDTHFDAYFTGNVRGLRWTLLKHIEVLLSYMTPHMLQILFPLLEIENHYVRRLNSAFNLTRTVEQFELQEAPLFLFERFLEIRDGKPSPAMEALTIHQQRFVLYLCMRKGIKNYVRRGTEYFSYEVIEARAGLFIPYLTAELFIRHKFPLTTKWLIKAIQHDKRDIFALFSTELARYYKEYKEEWKPIKDETGEEYVKMPNFLKIYERCLGADNSYYLQQIMKLTGGFMPVGIFRNSGDCFHYLCQFSRSRSDIFDKHLRKKYQGDIYVQLCYLLHRYPKFYTRDPRIRHIISPEEAAQVVKTIAGS